MRDEDVFRLSLGNFSDYSNPSRAKERFMDISENTEHASESSVTCKNLSRQFTDFLEHSIGTFETSKLVQ